MRGRDDDPSGDSDRLEQGEGHVARSRRQIDHEVVEFTPVGRSEKLLDRPVNYGAAPDDRMSFLHEEGGRENPDPVGFRHDDPFLRCCPGLSVLDPEHEGDGRAIHIRIEQADPGSELLESDRQTECPGRLADPALTRSYGDDVLDTGEQVGVLAIFGTDLRTEADFDRGHALDVTDGLSDIRFDTGSSEGKRGLSAPPRWLRSPSRLRAS